MTVIDVGAEWVEGEMRPGLLDPAAIDALVEEIHRRSGGESRQATGEAASNLDLYQVNCTYYDALGRDDAAYLLARAIQFFAPGIPQVYYVGLLGGTNDLELLRRSGVGRDINRHYYTIEEIGAAIQRPMVERLFALIRWRNAHPAFGGVLEIAGAGDHELTLTWRNHQHWAMLAVDLRVRSGLIRASTAEGSLTEFEVAPETATLAGARESR